MPVDQPEGDGPDPSIDDNVYDVSYKRRFSIGLLASLLYCYLLQYVIMITQLNFNQPQVTCSITVATLITYNYGCYILQNTRFRRKLYFKVILYTFVYYFYTQVYVHGLVLMPTITYFLKVLQHIVHYQNKFSMQF